MPQQEHYWIHFLASSKQKYCWGLHSSCRWDSVFGDLPLNLKILPLCHSSSQRKQKHRNHILRSTSFLATFLSLSCINILSTPLVSFPLVYKQNVMSTLKKKKETKYFLDTRLCYSFLSIVWNPLRKAWKIHLLYVHVYRLLLFFISCFETTLFNRWSSFVQRLSSCQGHQWILTWSICSILAHWHTLLEIFTFLGSEGPPLLYGYSFFSFQQLLHKFLNLNSESAQGSSREVLLYYAQSETFHTLSWLLLLRFLLAYDSYTQGFTVRFP